MDTNPPPSAAAFTQLAVGGGGQRRDCRGCAGCRSFNRGTDAPDEQRSSHRRWNDRRADIHRSRNRRRAPKVMRGVQTGSAGGPNRDNGDNPAFANIATVNGAVMLQQTLNTTPALVPGERTDALALAEAYGQATAFAMEQDHPAWQSAANDVNAKDARMKAICGGG